MPVIDIIPKRRWRYPLSDLSMYLRLRRAYRKHGVPNFYSRKETLKQAQVAVRSRRV